MSLLDNWLLFVIIYIDIILIFWRLCTTSVRAVTVRRRMNMFWMIMKMMAKWVPGSNVASVSWLFLAVEGKPRENLNQEIDPTGHRSRARWMRSSNVISRSQRCFIYFFVTVDKTTYLYTLSSSCSPLFID